MTSWTSPPPPSKPKYLRCCSVAHSAHLCSSGAPGSLSPPDAHIRLVQARSVHPCARKMSAAYTVLQVPAHLVPRTCSGPRGKMALGAIHTDHITVLRPLLPPPRVGHEGRTFKPLRSRSRAKPSSQDSQQSTTPAALGPPLHPHSRVGGSWAGGGHPPCGPVKSAAAVCSAHTSGGESLSSAQGKGMPPGPGPERPGRYTQGCAVTEGMRPDAGSGARYLWRKSGQPPRTLWSSFLRLQNSPSR